MDQVSEARRRYEDEPVVVKVLSGHSLVIGVGSMHGVAVGYRYVVFGLSEDDLLNPITGENLGPVEIVRGTGVVSHVQEQMATLTSDMVAASERRRVTRQAAGMQTVVEEIFPPRLMRQFEGARPGDFARQIVEPDEPF